MGPKKAVAAEIRKSFSRYVNKDTKSEIYVYRDEATQNVQNDDDVLEIGNCTTTVINPLNGLKSVDVGVDYINGSEAKSTETIVETVVNDIQLSFDRQKEDDVDAEDRIQTENAQCHTSKENSLDDENVSNSVAVEESNICAEKAQQCLINHKLEGHEVTATIDNFVLDIASPPNCPDYIQAPCDGTQPFSSVATVIEKLVSTNGNVDNCTDIPSPVTCDKEPECDGFAFELSKYLKFYEKQKEECPTAVDKEIELIVGNQQALESPLIVVPFDSDAAAQRLQDDLALAANLPTNAEYVYTSQDGIYDVVWDLYDPTKFSIRLKTSTGPYNNFLSSDTFTGYQTGSSIFFNGQEIKPCSVQLKDFTVKQRKPNALASMTWYTEKPTVVDFVKPPSKKRRLEQQPHPKQQQPKHNKKKKSTSKRKIRADPKPKTETVVDPPAPIPIKRADQKKKKRKADENRVGEIQTTNIVIEEKTVSIKEWLEASQVNPDNNVYVNEFLQGGNLPVLSDIEDDLARYINFNNPTPQHVNQQLNDAKTLQNGFNEPVQMSQPLDLSVKQTTPMSTDTGFSNASFLDDVSPYRSSANKIPTYVHGEKCNFAWMDNNRRYERTNTENERSRSHKLFKPMEDALDLSKEQNDSVSAPSTNYYPESTAAPRTSSSEKIEPVIGMDWKYDNESTDLDYEPFEDDDDEEETNHSPPCETTFETTFNKAAASNWDRLTIQIPNNSDSHRVVSRPSSVDTERSRLSIATSINAVEPLSQLNLERKSTLTTRPFPKLEMIPYSLMKPVKDSSSQSLVLLGKQIKFLFNGICFNYLKGERCEALCKWNHCFPPAQDVLEKLVIFSKDTIMGIYTHFIAKNELSFHNYFSTVCHIFGNKKMESTLLEAVKHCDQHRKLFFYKNIFDALIMSGLSKNDALSKIIDRSCKNKTAYTVIVNIIVETDPLYFIEMLRKYYKLATIQTHHMMKLLNQVDDNPAPSLVKVFIDLFDKYSMSAVCDLGAFNILLLRARRFVADKPTLTRKLNRIASRKK